MTDLPALHAEYRDAVERANRRLAARDAAIRHAAQSRSLRAIARELGLSAMTVSRIARKEQP